MVNIGSDKKARICVVGFPSILGGADTELFHQMHIWNELGIEVHLLHHSDYSVTAKATFAELRERGYIIHTEKQYKEIDGMPCISYCAGPALEQLEQIREYTDTFIFVNCMTWLFPKEKECIKKGLITHELYQREEVKTRLLPQLLKLNNGVEGQVVKPYFDSSKFHFKLERDFKEFVFGRISREDKGKYHKETLPMAHNFVSPKMKHGIFLGVNNEVLRKIGKVPPWIKTLPAGGMPVEEFYGGVNAILQPCDPSHTENLPRISFEAMATGVTLIVDNRGGFKDQIIDGETGWLCDDYREFVYKASRTAFEVEERTKMAIRAREFLIDNWGFEACKEGWKAYLKDVGIL